jgi:hypothetical protein
MLCKREDIGHSLRLATSEEETKCPSRKCQVSPKGFTYPYAEKWTAAVSDHDVSPVGNGLTAHRGA